jgi:helicase
VPLKALASEKFEDFKKYYGNYTEIALSIGDFDSADNWLHKYDLIITTSEKLDSLLRHNVPWIHEIGTIIVDEVHMLDDAERGPTLEVLITRLKSFCPKAQFIALSATISNADEIAKWIGAELVKSDYRPIELREGVYIDGELDFKGKAEKLKGNSKIPELRILEDTLAKKKSMLLFVSSRRNAEASARKCAEIVENTLAPEEKMQLEKLSKDILDVLEVPTKQCEDLAACVKNGAAFHHAGLVSKQRSLIEEAFRSRLLKVICATPTLAMGLNLPAFRAVVRDLKRFDAEEGMGNIPVLEFKQMVGRAGRPGLEDHGEGIAIAKSVAEADAIFEHYIDGEPEEIFSKLSVEPVLRMQILGLIATGEIHDRKSLMDFFKRTFYAFQYKNIDKIEHNLDKIMNELVGWGFIKPEGQKLLPTHLGKRVAELYIDPYSAYRIMESFQKSNRQPLYYLHIICTCVEMRPLLYTSAKDFSALQQKSLEFEEIIPEAPSAWDADYENWFRAFKTALMLNDWINEKSEADILEQYRETPGILRNRLNNADWMLYSYSEIAHILQKKDELLPLRKLRVRVKYGAKEELLNLLRFEGIGRIRSRKLYLRGIKSASDVKKAELETIAQIIGAKVAKKLKEQVVSEKEESQQKLGGPDEN